MGKEVGRAKPMNQEKKDDYLRKIIRGYFDEHKYKVGDCATFLASELVLCLAAMGMEDDVVEHIFRDMMRAYNEAKAPRKKAIEEKLKGKHE
jgi:hypothetical protein